MADSDLLFARPPAANGALLFGPEEAPPPAVVDLTLAALLPPPTMAAVVAPVVAIRISAVLPALQFAAAARYDPRVERPTVARTRSAWQVAQVREGGAQDRHQGTVAAPAGIASGWQRAAPRWVTCVLPTSYRLRGVRPRTQLRHAAAVGIAMQPGRYAHADTLRLARAPWWFGHQDGSPRRWMARTPWQERARDRRPALQLRAQDAVPLDLPRGSRFQAGRDCRFPWEVRGQEARRPPPGQWLWPGGPPSKPLCYVPSPYLLFQSLPGGAALLFTCERGGLLPPRVIPVRKVYFVSNAVTMVRLPERTPLPVRSVEISVDAESWSWGFSAGLAASALPAVEPTTAGPVEIEVTVNGVVWVLLVEGYALRREFGRHSLTIRGRSQSAYLAAPYASARSWTPATFYTARQLADAELARDGIATGFTLNWNLPDWLAPAGAWTYQALTPVEALGRIVGAVGGTLLPHPSTKALTACARYRTAPWEWAGATPAVSLPLDAVSTLDLRWQEKPTFNAVYVAGERQGVIGHVVRAGTAGDRVAPMVVDALITHADAARERGRAILADTGKQALVTLELPLLAETGLLDPGLLIAVGDGAASWHGLVRATRIAAAWNDSLTVRQIIEVERHYA